MASLQSRFWSILLLLLVVLQFSWNSEETTSTSFSTHKVKPGTNPSSYQCCGDHIINATTTGCCVDTPFDSTKQLCCASKIVDGGTHNNKTTCCGSIAYNPSAQACCSSVLSDQKIPQNNVTCCGNQTIVIGSGKQCCGSSVFNPSKNESCCGTAVINLKKQSCCNKLIIDQPFVTNYNCCTANGAKKAYYYDPTREICCNGTVRQNHTTGHNIKCCGKDSYDASTEACCKDTVYNNVTHGCCSFSSVFNRAKQICCGDTPIPLSESCCHESGYNPAKEICCLHEVLESHNKNKSCCESEQHSTLFDPISQTCCSDGRVLSGGFSKPKCCPLLNGKASYNSASEYCCGDQVITKNSTEWVCCGLSNPTTAQAFKAPKVGETQMCCQNKSRDTTGFTSPFCCQDKVYDRTGRVSDWACCGNKAYNSNVSMCCNGEVATKPSGSLALNVKCCGTKAYDKLKDMCCDDDTTSPAKIYPTPLPALKPFTGCCGNKLNPNVTEFKCCKTTVTSS